MTADNREVYALGQQRHVAKVVYVVTSQSMETDIPHT